MEKKSPLKIYANKPQIGSAYANPNFTMLLKTVETLLSFCYTHIRNNESFLHLLAPEERMLLLNFDFIEKLLSDHYETIAAGIVRIICRNSLHASEKVAVVLMRGFSRLGH